MQTDENKQADVVIEETNEGSGTTEQIETISIPKSEYDKTIQTLGSLKREIKDLKKSKVEPEESSKASTKTDDSRSLERIEKMALRTAGITHEDDIDLARNTAKKWKVDIEEVLDDEDFKIKLERQQSNRSNLAATSGIKGGAGSSQAKFTAEYWISKETPPTPADVPDRKVRAKIIKAVMDNNKSSKTFYND